MGSSHDPFAVLDSKMRVRGTEGLRICDLSAMPTINAGNTNAPAMMMGSRCAEFVAAGLVSPRPSLTAPCPPEGPFGLAGNG